MWLDYILARPFLPGFQPDNAKNGMKRVKCWGNVNKANDMSKNHVGDTSLLKF